mmetsp:Transcript_47432/g.120126  ORF Transcript_47432/g.120126 Transcript_47432/m.120126 type:complete len:98 (-) Transcript_47432:75-368(-)
MMRVLLAVCSALVALGQELRGAAEGVVAVAAAEYPMKEVPTDPTSGLAIASLACAIVAPIAGIGIMLYLKEKGWWGACGLIGGVIMIFWVYTAYLAF